MEKDTRRLSLKRILWTDYPAFYASLIPVVAWTVYLAWAPDWRGEGPVIQPEARPFFLGLAIVASGVSLVVLALRLRIFFRTFYKGTQVRGKISKVELRRDRGRVEYVYIFGHKEYFAFADVHRNAQTKELKAGEPVMLMVDPSKPSRSFICDLYTET